MVTRVEALQGSSARPVLNNKTTTMNPGAVKFFDALFFVHWQPRNQRKTLQLVLKSLNSQKSDLKNAEVPCQLHDRNAMFSPTLVSAPSYDALMTELRVSIYP